MFGLEPRADILQRMVRYQLAKRRSGTASCQGSLRDQLHTTAKMYRQKGTGRARHGSQKAPLFRGGGKAFGPKPRSFAIDLPKKVRALALKHALSSKAKSETLIVIDKCELKDAKTKELKSRFAKLGFGSVLIIDGAAGAGGLRPRRAQSAAMSTCSRSPASMSTTSCGTRSWC